MAIVLSEFEVLSEKSSNNSCFSDYDDADDIDQMKLYDDDDNDVDDDFLEDLQRQNECQHEGISELLLVGFNPGTMHFLRL